MEQQLQDTYTLKAGEKEVSVFMSFFLLNKLAETCGGVAGLDNAVTDAKVQQKLAELLLTNWKETDVGDVVADGKKASFYQLSSGQVADLLGWAYGHLSDFFIRTTTSLAEQTKKAQKLMASNQ